LDIQSYLHVNTIVTLSYYLCVEIIPCILVLFVLSRLPNFNESSIDSQLTESGNIDAKHVQRIEERTSSLILSEPKKKNSYGTVYTNN